MTTVPGEGALAVVRERVRQVFVEGHDPARDRQYTARQLAWAGWCYADRALSDNPADPVPPLMWPLAPEEWKPGDPLRMLVKAAALYAAEIDRILYEREARG